MCILLDNKDKKGDNGRLIGYSYLVIGTRSAGKFETVPSTNYMAQPHVQHMGTTWDILESFGTTLQQYQDNCETILGQLWDHFATISGQL